MIHSWGVHLPAVTGDVTQEEDGVGLHLRGTVLLGDVVVQGRVMSRGSDPGNTCVGRAGAGLAPCFLVVPVEASPELFLTT